MTIKEQLKGTCVLNEKEGMGAEIVALYTEAGIENDEALVGDCIGEYYGERDGIIDNQVSKEYFQTILTLSQLREIVSTPEYKEPIKWSFAKETSPELEEQIKNAKAAKINSSEGIAQPISEPQFKAGDVVDVKMNSWEDFDPRTEEYVTFLPKTNQHLTFDTVYRVRDSIRHPKDKLREKAEELIRKDQVLFEELWYRDLLNPIQKMLIEAIKWGQENK